MALFHFENKKEEKPACCCGSQTEAAEEACCGGSGSEICCIKVLGAGCKSCHQLYENTKSAVASMGLPVAVEYITDMEKLMEYGVMSMPALVVDQKVVSAGRVLKAQEVESLLRKLGY